MLSQLAIVQSRTARALFLASAAVTGAIWLWAHGLSPTGRASGLAPIFFQLFTIGDSVGAYWALLILLAAAAVPGRFSARPVLLWVGRHPAYVAFATVLMLSYGACVVYRKKPLSMDEYAPYFQSAVFATGHITGRFPAALLDWLIPPGFQDYFLNVSHATGKVASAYWPSFALLLTPFTWLGIPWVCNPVISAVTVIAVHRLAISIFGDVESAGLAVLLTVASPVFFADGISFYSMPAHLLANTVFALLLVAPTCRKVFCAGVVGSIALTLHNPVPHMLFAAPWIISILRRPGGLRLARWLFVGYAPLCVVLGLGWFLFSSHLTHDGMLAAMGGSATSESAMQMRSTFTLPDRTILLARLIGIAKLWVWAVPGMLLLAVVGAWRWRSNQICKLLMASALFTLLGYVVVPFDQGHGWGYRYFHSAWMTLPILATAALARMPANLPQGFGSPATDARQPFFHDGRTLTFVFACAILSLLAGTTVRALQMAVFIRRHQAQMPAYAGIEHRLVVLDSRLTFYGADLVQNDPWLRDNEIRMFTHGPVADAKMAKEFFPDMHPVYADRFGTVWSTALETNSATSR